MGVKKRSQKRTGARVAELRGKSFAGNRAGMKAVGRGKNMTGTVGAEKAGGQAEQKAPEKRRALGRGLESLLPGPRMVAPAASPFAKDGSASSGGAVQSGGGAGET